MLRSVTRRAAHLASQAQSIARGPAGMGWSDVWDDILQGGSNRWKIDDLTPKAAALARILQTSGARAPGRLFVPLAGDDPIVKVAWEAGWTVAAAEGVPAAVAKMRAQFGDDAEWTSTPHANGNLVWTHASGRVTIYEGDAFRPAPELLDNVDAFFDKDSFGAIPQDLRNDYCRLLSTYARDNAVYYIEVKYKADAATRANGPPFHLEAGDLLDPATFGTDFELVESLGEVYKIDMDTMRQTGHVLRRKARAT